MHFHSTTGPKKRGTENDIKGFMSVCSVLRAPRKKMDAEPERRARAGSLKVAS